MRNGLTLAQTRSDGSGKWSVHLTGLPDGNNTVTAKSISNSGYAYYLDTPDGVAVRISQLRLNNNAINPNSPYPLTLTLPHFILVPSPTANKFYATLNLNASSVPALFDSSSPADPVAVINYPAGKTPNIGAYSADGTKYFSPNNNEHTVSVVDVASNTWLSNIDVGQNSVTAWRAPNGNIYVNTEHGIVVIDPTTGAIIKTITTACADYSGSTTTFSQDSAYPYYFTFCRSATPSNQKVLKYTLANDELVGSATIDFDAVNAVMNADNSKLYVVGAGAGNTNTDKMRVFDTTTTTYSKSITTHAGVIAIFQSPDLQHIYAATPSYNFDQTGFDIVDMFTDTAEHIETNTVVPFISAASSAVTLSNVNVSVVLGVKTTAGSLANTGAIAVSATLLSGLIIGSTVFIYYDYRRHKKPLVEADPTAHYTLAHHLKVVTIPLLKYRLSVQVARNPSDSSGIHRF